MCRLRTYLSLSAVKTSQNLPNDGATPTLRNGRVQLLSGHLDCFNGPRPAATSHKRPRKQRKVGLWNCLRAVRSDSPVLEGRPTVLHNIDHSNIYKKRVLTSFTFSLVDHNVTSKCVSSLASKSSSGHDGISLKLLKFLSPALFKTLIINQSLVTGIFPTKLKNCPSTAFIQKRWCNTYGQLSTYFTTYIYIYK